MAEMREKLVYREYDLDREAVAISSILYMLGDFACTGMSVLLLHCLMVRESSRMRKLDREVLLAEESRQ